MVGNDEGDGVVPSEVVVLDIEVVEIFDSGVEGVPSIVQSWIEICKPIDHSRPAKNIHISVKHSYLLDCQLREIKCVLVNGSHQNW